MMNYSREMHGALAARRQYKAVENLSDVESREFDSNVINFRKRGIANSSQVCSFICNIVATLSAFRSNAKPWRLFLCQVIPPWWKWKTILLKPTKWFNPVDGSFSGLKKENASLDSVGDISHTICNIVVTLSAFRSNAEPWRLFLCTPFEREWEMGS